MWLALLTSHCPGWAAHMLHWLQVTSRTGLPEQPTLPLSHFPFLSLITAPYPAARQSLEKKSSNGHPQPKQGPGALTCHLGGIPSPKLTADSTAWPFLATSPVRSHRPRAFALAVLPPAPSMTHFHLSFGSHCLGPPRRAPSPWAPQIASSIYPDLVHFSVHRSHVAVLSLLPTGYNLGQD